MNTQVNSPQVSPNQGAADTVPGTPKLSAQVVTDQLRSLGGQFPDISPLTPEERKIVRREEPEYPTIAAKMNLYGTVRLKIWITPEGSVRRLEYIGGHPVLAESALKAVKNWKYEPLPQESVAIVEVKF